jgi:hypothetical protein
MIAVGQIRHVVTFLNHVAEGRIAAAGWSAREIAGAFVAETPHGHDRRQHEARVLRSASNLRTMALEKVS